MKTAMITGFIGILIGLGIGWGVFVGMRHEMSSAGMETAVATGDTPRAIAYYQDPMHPWFTSDTPAKAPDCGMDMVPVYADDANVEGIRIDPVTVQNTGVATETVERRPLRKTIRAVGTVAYDERAVSTVTTRVMGWAEHLNVDYTGRLIRQGETLLDLYSPELVSAQEEYLQALKYRGQLQNSPVEEAALGGVQLLDSARRRLQYWGMPEADIAALESRGAPARTLPVRAPATGVVVDKMVIAGQKIMPGMDLYRIADLSAVWVMADIYPHELPWISVGQKVDVELSYLPGKAIPGVITFLYPYMNAEARTARVRVEVRNTADLDLKVGMFATVRIDAPLTEAVVAVPEQAIIRSGERNVVIVALGGGYFDPREVRLGRTGEGYVEALEGLEEGAKIVTSGQFLIDSESNLKAAIQAMRSPSAHPGH